MDLETVSLFSPNSLRNILSDEEKYKKTPFLFLLSSYVRNESISWANSRFKYIDKDVNQSWTIYCFQNQ